MVTMTIMAVAPRPSFVLSIAQLIEGMLVSYTYVLLQQLYELREGR
jgi:hypothetical protein